MRSDPTDHIITELQCNLLFCTSLGHLLELDHNSSSNEYLLTFSKKDTQNYHHIIDIAPEEKLF